MLESGERQVATTRGAIRRDHVARYEWAARVIGRPDLRVVDAASGVGYGAQILAEAGCSVLAIDSEPAAIEYGKCHFFHDSITWRCADLLDEASYPEDRAPWDVAVCFETIEHLADPRPMLRMLSERTTTLLASVPNEEALPFAGQKFHHRHYTAGQFKQLLADTGWDALTWFQQEGPGSEVEPAGGRFDGRTLVVIAKRTEERPVEAKDPAAAPPERPVPDHVVILGLGPSVDQYTGFVKRLGGRQKLCDEVWGINALGDVFQCDRLFHMDDVRIQQIRAEAAPESNVAAMLQWLKKHPGPVYTSRVHPDYPGLVAYPLEAVINSTGYAYLNNTAAYALALAVHLRVKKVTVFGCDYTYPNAHDAERGRGCLEFWLGFAAARGIKISIGLKSSLLDACMPVRERLYGYDLVDVRIEPRDGRYVVEMVERLEVPTAEEIEDRYDHSRHPSPLVVAVEE